MSLEGKTPEVPFPLKTWIEEMKSEDRTIIEADIFNNLTNVSIENVYKYVNQENARSILARCNTYLEAKKAKEDPAKLKAEASAIAAYIEEEVDKAME